MKRTSRLVALLLTLAMVLSLTACGNPAKKLYGTWSIDLDLTDTLTEELGEDFAGLDAEFVMTMYFDFNEDGTCKMYVEEEELLEDVNTWMDAMIDYTVEMMYESLEAEGIDRETADALLEEQFGMSITEYMSAAVEESVDFESMVEDMESEGVYEVKGNKLYIAEDEIDEDIYDIFTVEDGVLTIDEAEDADEGALSEMEGVEYPFVFNKVETAE